jgi:hypothetical protein
MLWWICGWGNWSSFHVYLIQICNSFWIDVRVRSSCRDSLSWLCYYLWTCHHRPSSSDTLALDELASHWNCGSPLRLWFSVESFQILANLWRVSSTWNLLWRSFLLTVSSSCERIHIVILLYLFVRRANSSLKCDCETVRTSMTITTVFCTQSQGITHLHSPIWTGKLIIVNPKVWDIH